ncbi:hypothetical protein [Senegalimassilia anaerobia]|uniref:hypothetical protein n=1 Tax=Senegalimassilia anaerobia TaxID=1473216 RepID=UPI0023F1D750|nr:hypothetical protein [Senegalimassilia anaerobia]
MNDEMTMPVFKPMRKRRMLLGLGLKEWMRVAFALIVGVALAFSLGNWKHEVEVALTATELQEVYGHYSLYQNALQKVEQMKSASGTSDMAALDLTADERTQIAEAHALGITSGMDRDELTELIPKSERRTMPVIPDIPRWMACLGIPLVLAVLLNVEVSHNTTLSKEAARVASHMRSQRVYSSKPRTYMKGA